jgi:hypothetical protein
MNHTDGKLAQALRELAGTAPAGAPPELETSLVGRFRRHHRRRRFRSGAIIAAVAAGLMAAASLPLWRKAAPPVAVVQAPSPGTASVQQPTAATTTPAIPQRQVTLSAATDARKIAPKRAQRRPAPSTADSIITATPDFVPLPAYDPAFPAGRSLLIRLEMPGTDLGLVGYPVTESLSERRVVTDVLVSEDGTPYAVRLVNARTTR